MTDSDSTLESDVVIIGGGPVGLSASLLLARHGVRSIVLEKHATTATHPKASAFNTRTMEILRQLGIADDVYTYIPNARPGARAPHAWLARAGQEHPVSIMDLFDTRFTLLVTPDNLPVSISTEVPLAVVSVGGRASNADLIDGSGDWRCFYGIVASGAVLVRPDGHVAWRGQGAVDAGQVEEAVARSLALAH